MRENIAYKCCQFFDGMQTKSDVVKWHTFCNNEVGKMMGKFKKLIIVSEFILLCIIIITCCSKHERKSTGKIKIILPLKRKSMFVNVNGNVIT